MLFVPGQPFSLLLPRSDAFNAFNVLFNLSYPDQREHPYMIALMQMLWDRVEPTGFSNHILENPFPGSSSPDVLVVDAIGDPAVSTRAAHVLARTLALPNLAPANREVFGLDAVEGPIERAALLEVSFGLEPEPVENVSWMPPFNPHDYPFGNATIQAIARQFLETGTIENLCDGVCDPD